MVVEQALAASGGKIGHGLTFGAQPYGGRLAGAVGETVGIERYLESIVVAIVAATLVGVVPANVESGGRRVTFAVRSEIGEFYDIIPAPVEVGAERDRAVLECQFVYARSSPDSFVGPVFVAFEVAFP